MEKSLAYFKEAVRLDHEYAAALAGAAQAYSHLAAFRFMPVDEGRANMERAARRAIALDPTLSDAHVALGEVYEQQLSFAAAEAEFRQAVALDANDPIAHQRLGYALERAGRVDEAVEETRAGFDRDPLSCVASADAGGHGVARVCVSASYGECREAALRSDIARLRQDGTLPLAIAQDFALLGKPEESIAYIQEAFARRLGAAFYEYDREWDNIRSDARFLPLARKYLAGRPD